MRELVGLWACRKFGVEGKDWLMVQDFTVIGFHACALKHSGSEGDAIILK